MLLGPTEDRVARYLADRTRNGRVTIRTADLVDALGLERSEAYRVTARLRVLGIFGIQNDQGGTNGGRRYWRTGIEHDGARLDATRHRVAWSRILAWARARQEVVAARLAGIRQPHTPHPLPPRSDAATPAVEASRTSAAGGSFADLFRRAGGGPLMAEWGVE
jgi:hypothetical protein